MLYKDISNLKFEELYSVSFRKCLLVSNYAHPQAGINYLDDILENPRF